ncbi:hypothetical protein ANO11243_048520 [Dothideomycetidae sp. 11243]|nr:hypothetical protein ANO11243_048520 [fungal sp. No.11243]
MRETTRRTTTYGPETISPHSSSSEYSRSARSEEPAKTTTGESAHATTERHESSPSGKPESSGRSFEHERSTHIGTPESRTSEPGKHEETRAPQSKKGKRAVYHSPKGGQRRAGARGVHQGHEEPGSTMQRDTHGHYKPRPDAWSSESPIEDTTVMGKKKTIRKHRKVVDDSEQDIRHDHAEYRTPSKIIKTPHSTPRIGRPHVYKREEREERETIKRPHAMPKERQDHKRSKRPHKTPGV